MNYEDVMNLISYDSESGKFYWNSTGFEIRGVENKRFGYLDYHLNFEGNSYQIAGHNLAWMLHTGKRPAKSSIVFKNGNKKDLRWINLALREPKPKKRMTPAKDFRKKYSAEDIEKLLHYDKCTGLLYWKSREGKEGRRFNKQFAGKLAGTQGKNPAVRIANECDVSRARIVWLLETGEWPDGVISYNDGDPTNTRFGNLRVEGTTHE